VACGNAFQDIMHTKLSAKGGHAYINPTDANRLRYWARTQFEGESRRLIEAGADAIENLEKMYDHQRFQGHILEQVDSALSQAQLNMTKLMPKAETGGG